VRGKGPKAAVTLLTVLPWPEAQSPSSSPSPSPGGAEPPGGAAMEWAPAVGLLLGAVGGVVFFVAGDAAGAGALTGAVLALATLALLTRGLHLDGLADLADGLGSGKPAAIALEIMRESDIGPMGVVTVLFTLLLQVAAVARVGATWPGALVLATGVITGRLAMTWACRTGVPAARPEGLGALVAGTVRAWVPAVTTAVLGAAAGLAIGAGAAGGGIRPGLTLAGGVLAGLGAAWALERHAVRRLGGITGDVLGAIAEVATTVTLVVAACGP
jgi:adenosylcobinamide-GDP ribazoletransferase